jgi:2-succinyl-5-enolpyruvyl-6-hydroxy-3-cyclohexene-1-carboxylate synthase
MELRSQTPQQRDVQATFCATLVDEWVRAGITDAVVCPGSRSTPLVLALSDARLRIHVRLDERSASFFALGLSLETSRAVVVCTTSGTAAAELHAGVIEAFHSGVPLVVCTADRPPRLKGVGANQTIDQSSLYASALVWSADPGVARWEERATWRSLASRAFLEATCAPIGPGPVHLNLPFDEPLVGSALELPQGRENGAPWHIVVASSRQTSEPSPLSGGALYGGLPPGADLLIAKRVVVVAGAGCGPPEDVLAAADALGAPVLADPLSGLRRRRTGVVAAGDSILRSDLAASALRPDVVLRAGTPHISKVLSERLGRWGEEGTTEVLLDGRWRWIDPDRRTTSVICADPALWWAAIASYLQRSPAGEPDRAWAGLWSVAESEAQRSIDEWCAAHSEATEPGVARLTLGVLGSLSTLVVASSMPIRDLEWYGAVSDDPPRVLANRGANGIDGVVSTAMGVASASDRPVVALVGDLAFLHDLTAFVGERSRCGLTVVVVDNSGGGIFSFLPQRTSLSEERFERLFATPQTQDVADVARGLGLRVAEASTIPDAADAILAACKQGAADGSTTVIRVSVPERDANVGHHEVIQAAVAKNVEAALARVT